MKRVMSIFLVLAMIITLAPGNILAAKNNTSAFSDVDNSDYCAEAAEALAEEGILSGYPDGTFGPGKTITRAEMAAIICRMIDRESDAQDETGATDFYDVDDNHWATGYINVASSMGIISGDGNGKFRPEDNVKYEEAIKMVVCALGYGDDVEMDEDDWSKGYLDVADEKGISDNLKGSKGRASTRGDVAVMVFNGIVEDEEAEDDAEVEVAMPKANLAGGTYRSVQYVSLRTETEDADIYYTLNGKTPTTKSNKYSKSIKLTAKYTLKAIAVKDGEVSDVLTVEYDVRIPVSSSSSKKYVVSFNLNYEGASNAPESQEVVKGKKATKPADPVRSNFGFAGWYSDKECNTLFDFDTKITEDKVLYAKWTNGYRVSFNLNYQGATNAPQDQYIPFGTKATEPSAPSRSGFAFLGWSTSASGEVMFNFNSDITSDMTLYAKWIAQNGDNPVSLDDVDPDVEIYSFDADIYDILVGETKAVTFTSEIFANVELADTDVKVVDKNGSLLGYMNDNGTNGDAKADDGIYTLRINMTADSIKNTLYFVNAKNKRSESSVNIGYYRNLTEEDFETYESVVESLDDIGTPDSGNPEYEDKESKVEGMKTKLDELKQSGEIDSYDVYDSHIKIKPSEGFEFKYILTEPDKYAGGSDKVKIVTYEPFRNTLSNSELNADMDKASDGNAELIATKDNAYVFSGNYDLGAVTLDKVKEIASAGVVIWIGHGGYDIENGSSLGTGEIATYASLREHEELINNGSLELWSGHRFAITGGYVKKYIKNLDNTLLYLNTCHSGQDMIDNVRNKYELAQAFLDNGAKAVVGTTNSVFCDYSHKFAFSLFDRLTSKDGNGEYYTLNNSVAWAKNKVGNKDASGTEFLVLPQNDEGALNYRLGELKYGYISGTVKDADTEVAISDALVRVYKDGILVEQARTNASGYYNIKVPVGEYIVKITAGNYKSAKMGVSVAENNTTYNETMLLVEVGPGTGHAKGTITSALTGNGVPGVTLKLRSGWNNVYGNVVHTLITNESGYYEITYTPGSYTMEYSKDGHITGYKNIVIGADGSASQNASISPLLAEGAYRITLSWKNLPYDLDSHLTGPVAGSTERFHLYYPMNESGGGHPDSDKYTLDLDNTDIVSRPDVYETTTIIQQLDGVYRFSVHDFTNSGSTTSTQMANSNATVNVYKGNSNIPVATFHVPTTAVGSIWTVFELNGDTITPINRISAGDAWNISLYSMGENPVYSSTTGASVKYDENVIEMDLIEK